MTIVAIQQGWVVPGVIVRVIDGDSLEIDLDLGWGVIYRKAVVRLAGVNCPEMSTAEGRKAAAFVRQLLAAGTPVQVLSHKRDKYGRVLANVMWQDRADDGTLARHDLGQLLLEEGLAVPFMVIKAAVGETR